MIARSLIGRLRSAAAWQPAEIAFWFCPVLLYFGLPSHLNLLAQTAILALAAQSLDFILGYAGIISLGHAALFGAGAYAAALLPRIGVTDPLIGLAGAAAIAGLLGLATSFLVIRGADLMMTLGIGLIVYEAANKMAWLTGGSDGISGINVGPLLGRFGFDLSGRTGYVYSFAALFLGFILLRRLTRSPFGLALRGIHGNERRMQALGVPVSRYLVCAYTISAAVAGIAGALLTQTNQFVSLSALDFGRSAEFLLVVTLGGKATLYGAIIGAFVYAVLRDSLSTFTQQFWQFWIGVLLIAIVLFAPNGLAGVSSRLVAYVREKLP